jgi:tetratricopeptide (TPR) repeat protein
MLNDALIMSGRNAAQKINIYNVLGLVYDELGDLEKSSVAFETALGIDPKNAETLTQYSLVLSRRISQSEKALSMTERVLSQSQHPPMIHELLAEVLYNQKKYKEAYASIHKAIGPGSHGDVYNLAGDILLKMGNAGEAVRMWEKALETGSTDMAIKKKIADHKTP